MPQTNTQSTDLERIVFAASSASTSLLLNNLQEGVAITDSRGRIRYVNPLFGRLFLDSPVSQSAPGKSSLTGKPIFRSFGFEVPEQKHELLESALKDCEPKRSTRVGYTKSDGSKIYVNISITPLADRSGAQIGFGDVTREVIEATVDGLTGAYTQTHFVRDLFPREVRKAERSRPAPYLGIAVIDLKRFKGINDRYGHSTGDKMLKDVAGLLQSTIRLTDYLIRYGGDEFYVLLPNTNEEEGKVVIKRIEQAEKNYNKSISKPDLKMKMDIGFFSDNKDYGKIIGKADRRMYANKHGGAPVGQHRPRS